MLEPLELLTPRRALLIANPRSGRAGHGLEAAASRFVAAGIAVERLRYTCPTEISPAIRERASSLDLVIVGGGDGTLNAAAAGLKDTGLALGILPLGTANDLARTLRIPMTVPAAADVIAHGRIEDIDVGEVNGHLYFNVASVGMSADLARALTPEAKKRFGTLAYLMAAMKVVGSARPFRADITWRGGAARVRTLQIAVGNGRHYGGGMTVERDASIDDGFLDLYSLEVREVWKLLLMAADFRSGRHGAWRDVRTGRCTEFDIATRRPRPINCDGELVTFTPARFKLHRNAVRVVLPRLA